ncbi:MAG: hypothetical protein K9W43_14225 [Candidatus Thorarchaeota archaeon]|nr:hypothetical protein [Candidatus Thorarchaeota archaeon]
MILTPAATHFSECIAVKRVNTFTNDNYTMSIETELKEIKKHILEISKKLDELIHERELVSLMKLSEKSLDFLVGEPDIYNVENLRIRYK